ncbi:MAG TPA: secretin N-terminal domain-containing protein [Thermoanaerobaculia bacterium]|jgi:general secretion pathway protein D
MKRLKATAATLMFVLLTSCAGHNAYQKARDAEALKNWDTAVVEYENALEIDPDNSQYKVSLERARREASRVHFEKGKTYRASADTSTGADQLRLAQMALSELQLTVKLDPTNQFAAVEMLKVVELINNIQRAAAEQTTLDDVKARARANIAKAQPPQLNPASADPISLTFPRDTPVKDIYRALGNAYGINVLFDQAVKDDRVTIELRDVTAQQAIERVMQAANHFYKVLDERTIIVIPDNPQARRDYEDLVIRTFYLSNGDAEQVTNVVRTMIEARNVFPLKALNAITIRDTADKVMIAEKIIEANDKARAEVVVQVELVELDLNRLRELGLAISGFPGTDGLVSSATATPRSGGNNFTGGTLNDIARVVGSISDLRENVTFAIPTATYSLLKTYGSTEQLANPELRISEGEKATLHIGQQIPVPVTTIAAYNQPTTTTNNQQQVINPYGSTSFNYRDVGIKVAIEPRVHHNREVTLKLTVEVSNLGNPVTFAGQSQPTFTTRTIESTIRLKDGETNFLAGLIQTSKGSAQTKTPFLGDLPFIGRLFTNEKREERRTDLVLTMTPHIIRIPDITEEDLAPMWVGTGNNLTFRGVSPRIESQNGGGDPFVAPAAEQQFNNMRLSSDGEPGNYVIGTEGATTPTTTTPAPPRAMPTDPFNRPPANQPPPDEEGQQPPDADMTSSQSRRPPVSQDAELAAVAAALESRPVESAAAETARLRLAPRIAPQPSSISLGAGDTAVWNIIGMDLDGLSAEELVLRFDPRSINVTEVQLGPALAYDMRTPPAVKVDSDHGVITVRSTNGKPLAFTGGGQVLAIRVHGGVTGESFLVMDNPDFRTASGQAIVAAVAGGRARIQ